MVVMALDHVRDFFHRAAMSSSSPTDLRVASAALFMTRWVTHICAPVFMLTAGLGAYFYWKNGNRTKGQLSWFLVTRGLWLIVLELTVMQLAYNFDVSSSYPIFLLVLWVLGASMILLAALVWLPITWLALLSVATIVLHHLLDGIQVWPLVHQVSVFEVAGLTVIAPYTLVPWFAVMALGFCIGPIFSRGPEERRRSLIRIGVGITIAFVVIRALNIYGDPAPWSAQALPPRTLLSFLNTTKYPPSLAFLLMTLGPALLVLAWLDRRDVVGKQSAGRVRPGAAVLFRPALLPRARRGGSDGGIHVRRRSMELHVSAGAFHGWAGKSISGRIRVRPVDDLRCVDCYRRSALSLLSSIRAIQGTSPHMVGFLHLAHPHHPLAPGTPAPTLRHPTHRTHH